MTIVACNLTNYCFQTVTFNTTPTATILKNSICVTLRGWIKRAATHFYRIIDTKRSRLVSMIV